MEYHKLRIAWSIAWGVACVLLVALWVRSWSKLDTLAGHLPGIDAISCTSAYGRVSVGVQSVTQPWRLNYHNAVLDENSFGGRPKGPRKWFIYQTSPFVVLQLPHGFLVSLLLLGAVLPWLPVNRYSLRTLLIGITVAAIGLGWIVYAISN